MKYQGVSWHELAGKWQASCKTVYIGLYGTEAEAAEARWQYEQIAKPEIEVASTPATQLLSGMRPGKPEKPEKPATEAASLTEEQKSTQPAENAARPAKWRAAEALWRSSPCRRSVAPSWGRLSGVGSAVVPQRMPVRSSPLPVQSSLPPRSLSLGRLHGNLALRKRLPHRKRRPSQHQPRTVIDGEAVVDEQQLVETYAKLATLDTATPEEKALMPR